MVDTPGFGDSDKEDSVLIDEMMGVLKNTVKSASVLLIVLDGGQVSKLDCFECKRCSFPSCNTLAQIVSHIPVKF